MTNPNDFEGSDSQKIAAALAKVVSGSDRCVENGAILWNSI